MIEVYKNSKIYIVCPAGKSGGTNSLHQLGAMLSKKFSQVYIYYMCSKNKEIPEKLLYNYEGITIARQVEDSHSNILIVPESQGATKFIYQFPKMRHVVWWLSWDFYTAQFASYNVPFSLKRRGVNDFLRKVLYWPLYIKYSIQDYKGRILKTERDFREAYHLFNCEYVRQNIEAHGALKERTHFLCGPITDNTTSINEYEKEDLIIYGVAKADPTLIGKITEELKKRQRVDLCPIADMSKDEVENAMKKAKVYFDMGTFPGPERMPREAVSHYCNIVVANEGSARNCIDFPIPQKYKVDKKDSNRIVDTILELLNDYDVHLNEFDDYRAHVRRQKDRFELDVLEIFEEKQMEG